MLRDAEGAARTRSALVRAAVLRFVAASLAVIFVVLVVAVLVSAKVARSEALKDASKQTRQFAATVIRPLVTEDLEQGQPGADAALRESVAIAGFVAVKIWEPDGRIVWSNAPSLVGVTFPLQPEVRSLFGSTRSSAEVSRLVDPDNSFERPAGKLLEVYAGTYDSRQRPLVFEAYLPLDGMRQHQLDIQLPLILLASTAALIVAASAMPLALRLANRVERYEIERSRLVEHALRASELERRRLARDLHDGVIQDLAGIGYALPSVDRRLGSEPEAAGARRALSRIEEIVQRNLVALRTMLTDITPPALDGEGLVNAFHDLALTGQEAGIQVRVLVEEGPELPRAAAALAYRIAREGLRNVVKHAAAASATLELSRYGNQVVVRVVDDGQGLAAEAPAATSLGLRLLRDTITDLGGTLRLGPATGAGTELEARFPRGLGL